MLVVAKEFCVMLSAVIYKSHMCSELYLVILEQLVGAVTSLVPVGWLEFGAIARKLKTSLCAVQGILKKDF